MAQDEFDAVFLKTLEVNFLALEKKTLGFKGLLFDDLIQDLDVIIKNKLISKKARLSQVANLKSKMIFKTTETSCLKEVRKKQIESISSTLVTLLMRYEGKDLWSYMRSLCEKIKDLKLIKDFTDLSSINTNRIPKTLELCFCLLLNTKSYEEDTFFNVSFLSSERI